MARDFHILRTARVRTTRGLEAGIALNLEAEAAREAGEAEAIEGMGEVEEVGVGPNGRRKKPGAQNGRMSIRLLYYLHTD